MALLKARETKTLGAKKNVHFFPQDSMPNLGPKSGKKVAGFSLLLPVYREADVFASNWTLQSVMF